MGYNSNEIKFDRKKMGGNEYGLIIFDTIYVPEIIK